ncbi:cytochrome P450 [Streptomyces formicae]|uniref:Putative cytochrome P450 hydroxylase n=1 Tax=Streptomyces formicae TaxID=1616117 RepID=A0A291QL82_9ACTN|nr:cytochrome P450 [Streptomyces formicae]ATL32471.1 putative cytochrome P450 hydroxylase [Streptomyces formicae]
MSQERGTIPLYTRRTGLDPSDELRRATEGQPVSTLGEVPEGGTAWLVTGYHEVRQVLGDHVRFSTRRRVGSRAQDADGYRPDEAIGQLMDYDPPDHTRLRKMLTPEFTHRRIRRLGPRIEEIVEERLDHVERAGQPADLVERFATPVAGAVLCELIGVPRDDRGDFLRRCHTHLATGQGRQRRASAGNAFTRYLAALVARQRADPDEGFIGMLVRDHGEEFTDKELRGVCVLLMLAGLDNISGMIGLGTLALLQHPDQLAALRRDPAALDRAVDELLRHLSVPHAPTPRTALEDVTVAGRRIKAGDTVVCSIPMANRDPALTALPDRLDLMREPVAHVAFGHGIHHCLGAALARQELRIAFAALLRRFPALRVAEPARDVAFRVRSTAYGVESLPVAW